MQGNLFYSLPITAFGTRAKGCNMCLDIISCVKLLALKIVNMGSNGFSVPLFSMPCIYPLLYLFVLLLLLCSVVVIVVLHRKCQTAYLPVWRLDRPYPQQDVSSVWSAFLVLLIDSLNKSSTEHIYTLYALSTVSELLVLYREFDSVLQFQRAAIICCTMEVVSIEQGSGRNSL